MTKSKGKTWIDRQGQQHCMIDLQHDRAVLLIDLLKSDIKDININQQLFHAVRTGGYQDIRDSRTIKLKGMMTRAMQK